MRARAAALAAVAVAVPAKAEPAQARCVTHKCWHRVSLERHARWAKRHPWLHRWHHVSRGDQSWLRSTAWCESRNDPHTNTGNGFYGLLQFDLRTAYAAGFRQRPDLTSWHQQAVRGVWWMHREGTSPWPVCG